MIKGIGIDIVYVERIKKVYAEHGERFIHRVFLPEEFDYIRRTSARFYERMASTFSAKEATFKTLGMRRPIIFRDIQIIRTPQPVAKLHGITYDFAKSKEINHIFLSITHDEGICIAIALAI